MMPMATIRSFVCKCGWFYYHEIPMTDIILVRLTLRNWIIPSNHREQRKQ